MLYLITTQNTIICVRQYVYYVWVKPAYRRNEYNAILESVSKDQDTNQKLITLRLVPITG